MRFEPTVPAYKRGKTVHAFDGAATVISLLTPAKLCRQQAEVTQNMRMNMFAAQNKAKPNKI
jgi:hypothetical protein